MNHHAPATREEREFALREMTPKCWLPTEFAWNAFLLTVVETCRVEGCLEPPRKWYYDPEPGFYCLIHDVEMQSSAIVRQALKQFRR